jgi:hypothetical protein
LAGGQGRLLDYHRVPVPATCDVCQYVSGQQINCANEHALVRLATNLLIEKLQELQPRETTHLAALAVRETGWVTSGPSHSLEPRHWFWAIYHAPEIRLGLREDSNG